MKFNKEDFSTPWQRMVISVGAYVLAVLVVLVIVGQYYVQWQTRKQSCVRNFPNGDVRIFYGSDCRV